MHCHRPAGRHSVCKNTDATEALGLQDQLFGQLQPVQNRAPLLKPYHQLNAGMCRPERLMAGESVFSRLSFSSRVSWLMILSASLALRRLERSSMGCAAAAAAANKAGGVSPCAVGADANAASVLPVHTTIRARTASGLQAAEGGRPAIIPATRGRCVAAG